MPVQDQIILSDLAFYGYHGVFGEENKLGQRFRIDLHCGIDLMAAGKTDRLDASLHYGALYETVKTAFSDGPFKLIEAVGQHIVDAIFANYPSVQWVRIRVRKPEAPIPMVTGEAAIELYRERGQ